MVAVRCFKTMTARREGRIPQLAFLAFLAPFQSLPFDSACVPEYARIRDHLERERSIIGGSDLIIAAIALTHDLTVATHNCDEFKRVLGLRVEDWSG